MSAENTVDIHKPKPVHGWREFLSEIAVIVRGIALALIGEQIVEAIHWHHNVEASETAATTELGDDLRWALLIKQDGSCTKGFPGSIARCKSYAIFMACALAAGPQAHANQPAPQTPTQVVQTAVAAMQSGDLPLLNQIFAPDGPWHLPGGAERKQGGPYADLSGSCPMCARLADRQIHIEVLVAQGDLVSVRTRWTGNYSGVIQGVTFTNRPVTLTYQNIYRVSGERIVENWADSNSMDLARQLGFTVTAPPVKPTAPAP